MPRPPPQLRWLEAPTPCQRCAPPNFPVLRLHGLDAWFTGEDAAGNNQNERLHVRMTERGEWLAVAKDAGVGGAKSKSSVPCMCAAYYFLRTLRARARQLYWVSHPDHPTRLFSEIDYKFGDAKHEAAWKAAFGGALPSCPDDVLVALLDRMQAFLQSRGFEQVDARLAVSAAHKLAGGACVKASWHIVWMDFLISDGKARAALYGKDGVFQRDPHLGPLTPAILDCTTGDSWRSMRMLHCTKSGEERYLEPVAEVRGRKFFTSDNELVEFEAHAWTVVPDTAQRLDRPEDIKPAPNARGGGGGGGGGGSGGSAGSKRPRDAGGSEAARPAVSEAEAARLLELFGLGAMFGAVKPLAPKDPRPVALLRARQDAKKAAACGWCCGELHANNFDFRCFDHGAGGLELEAKCTKKVVTCGRKLAPDATQLMVQQRAWEADVDPVADEGERAAVADAVRKTGLSGTPGAVRMLQVRGGERVYVVSIADGSAGAPRTYFVLRVDDARIAARTTQTPFLEFTWNSDARHWTDTAGVEAPQPLKRARVGGTPAALARVTAEQWTAEPLLRGEVLVTLLRAMSREQAAQALGEAAAWVDNATRDAWLDEAEAQAKTRGALTEAEAAARIEDLARGAAHAHEFDVQAHLPAAVVGELRHPDSKARVRAWGRVVNMRECIELLRANLSGNGKNRFKGVEDQLADAAQRRKADEFCAANAELILRKLRIVVRMNEPPPPPPPAARVPKEVSPEFAVCLERLQHADTVYDALGLEADDQRGVEDLLEEAKAMFKLMEPEWDLSNSPLHQLMKRRLRALLSFLNPTKLDMFAIYEESHRYATKLGLTFECGLHDERPTDEKVMQAAALFWMNHFGIQRSGTRVFRRTATQYEFMGDALFFVLDHLFGAHDSGSGEDALDGDAGCEEAPPPKPLLPAAEFTRTRAYLVAQRVRTAGSKDGAHDPVGLALSLDAHRWPSTPIKTNVFACPTAWYDIKTDTTYLVGTQKHAEFAKNNVPFMFFKDAAGGADVGSTPNFDKIWASQPHFTPEEVDLAWALLGRTFHLLGLPSGSDNLQVALMLFGPGGCGKSAVAELMEQMRPSGAVATLQANTQQGVGKHTHLIGRALVVAWETLMKLSDPTEIAFLKQMIANEKVTITVCGKRVWEGRFHAALLLCGNLLPLQWAKSKEDKSALARRLVIVPFKELKGVSDTTLVQNIMRAEAFDVLRKIGAAYVKLKERLGSLKLDAFIQQNSGVYPNVTAMSAKITSGCDIYTLLAERLQAEPENEQKAVTYDDLEKAYREWHGARTKRVDHDSLQADLEDALRSWIDVQRGKIAPTDGDADCKHKLLDRVHIDDSQGAREPFVSYKNSSHWFVIRNASLKPPAAERPSAA